MCLFIHNKELERTLILANTCLENPQSKLKMPKLKNYDPESKVMLGFIPFSNMVIYIFFIEM